MLSNEGSDIAKMILSISKYCMMLCNHSLFSLHCSRLCFQAAIARVLSHCLNAYALSMSRSSILCTILYRLLMRSLRSCIGALRAFRQVDIVVCHLFGSFRKGTDAPVGVKRKALSFVMVASSASSWSTGPKLYILTRDFMFVDAMFSIGSWGAKDITGECSEECDL